MHKAILMYIGILLSGNSAMAEPVARDFDFLQLKRGGQLFQQHCAACHGKQGEGAVNWQQAGPDGKYPPPALNGTAHAWHHPTRVLMDVIKNGTGRIGGNMPAWKDKLTDEQITDIIAWFQSKWSDEIYAVWYRRNQQAMEKR